MDRIINVKVGGNHLSKDSKNAGARGEANVTKLRITFDKGWDTFKKKITFWDARGLNPVVIDLLPTLAESESTYIVPIPKEPMTEVGMFEFVIEGTDDDKVQRSFSDKLEVKESPIAKDAGQPVPPTEDELTQLSGAINEIKSDIITVRKAREEIRSFANSADEDAETAKSAMNSAKESADKAQNAVGKVSYIGENGNWFAWNGETEAFYDTEVKAQAGSTVYCGDNPPDNADVWVNPNGEGGIYSNDETLKNVLCYGSNVAPSDQSLFEIVDVNDENMTASIRAVSEDIEGDIVIPYEYTVDGKTYVITKIATTAFYMCEKIKSLTIPSTVTQIGNSAFRMCIGLKRVNLPESIQALGVYAFTGCSSLTSIVVPPSVRNGVDLGFWGCTSLKNAVIHNGNMGLGMFADCPNLESITIGREVSEINEAVVGGCESLKNVYYEGTEEEWSNIPIGIDNETLLNATIHFEVPTKLDDAIGEIISLREIVNTLYAKSLVKTVKISLPSSAWEQEGESKYSQTVAIDGVTQYSKIDLQPTTEQLLIFYEKDVTFVAVNDGGTVTVYCIGQKPANDYEIQATITEVLK